MKRLFLLIAAMFCLFTLSYNTSNASIMIAHADFGDYGLDSDSGGGGGGGQNDSYYYYNEGGSSSGDSEGVNLSKKETAVMISIIAAASVLVIMLLKYLNKRSNKKIDQYYAEHKNDKSLMYDVSDQCMKLRQQIDEERFCEYIKDLFIRLQKAWEEQDLRFVRNTMTDELYDRNYDLLQVRYINSDRTNKIEVLSVDNIEIMTIRNNGGGYAMEAEFTAVMKDYVFDNKTKEIVRGSESSKRREYKWMLICDEMSPYPEKWLLSLIKC